MHKQNVSITIKVSDTLACEGCRMLSKYRGGCTCLIYNQVLSVGHLGVYKCQACLNSGCGVASAAHINCQDEPVDIDPQMLMKETLKTFKKQYSSLCKQGIPANIAWTMAEKNTLK